MKSVFALVVLFTFVLVNRLLYSESPAEERERNLAEYDTVGPYDFVSSDWATARRWRNEIRAFIWHHWQVKKRAFLQAKYYTKEGECTVVRYFIEPDSAGRWSISIEEQVNTIDRRTKQTLVAHRRFNIHKVALDSKRKNRESTLQLFDDGGEVIREL